MDLNVLWNKTVLCQLEKVYIPPQAEMFQLRYGNILGQVTGFGAQMELKDWCEVEGHVKGSSKVG